MASKNKGQSKQKFGGRLRALRDAKGLSQSALSDATNISQSHISRIEKDAVKPSPDILPRFAHVFAISLEELVRGTDLETVLNPAGFPEGYAYCPNIECPQTLYRFWDADGAFWNLATVKNLWDSINDNKHAEACPTSTKDSTEDSTARRYYGDADLIDLMPPQQLPNTDLTPLERLRQVNGEVEYRWVKLDENSKFCEYCGTKLINTCPHCQVVLKMRNQKFCHGCGRRLNRPFEEQETEVKDGFRSHRERRKAGSKDDRGGSGSGDGGH